MQPVIQLTSCVRREAENTGLVCIKILELDTGLGWNADWLWSMQNHRAVQSITSEGEMGTPGNNSRLCRDRTTARLYGQDHKQETEPKKETSGINMEKGDFFKKRTVPCRNAIKAPEVPVFPVLYFLTLFSCFVETIEDFLKSFPLTP